MISVDQWMYWFTKGALPVSFLNHSFEERWFVSDERRTRAESQGAADRNFGDRDAKAVVVRNRTRKE